MKLETARLILRPRSEADADSLFEHAKDPDVGPIAGWPPHKSAAESLDVIKNVLNGPHCYAICEKDANKAIGSIALKLKGYTDMTERDDECELGYWLGKPFWGREYLSFYANRPQQFTLSGAAFSYEIRYASSWHRRPRQ